MHFKNTWSTNFNEFLKKLLLLVEDVHYISKPEAWLMGDNGTNPQVGHLEIQACLKLLVISSVQTTATNDFNFNFDYDDQNHLVINFLFSLIN